MNLRFIKTISFGIFLKINTPVLECVRKMDLSQVEILAEKNDFETEMNFLFLFKFV